MEGSGTADITKNPSSRGDNPRHWGQEPEVHRHYGLYKGKVEQRTDPDRNGRLRVRVIGVHSDEIPIEHLPWASPMLPAWNKGGCFVIPPLGEHVWIQFEVGIIDYPVWHAGWWKTTQTEDGKGQSKNKQYPTCAFGSKKEGLAPLTKEKLPGVKNEDQPNNFLPFTSPLGKHMEFDDRTDHQGMKFSDQYDNFFHINSETGSLMFRTYTGKKIEKEAQNARDRGMMMSTKDEVIQTWTHDGWLFTIDDKNDYFHVQSPNGAKVFINDKDGSKSVQAWSADGRYVVMDDEEKVMQMASKSGERVVAIDDDEKSLIARIPEGYVHMHGKDPQPTMTLNMDGKIHINGKDGVYITSTEGDIVLKSAYESGKKLYFNSRTQAVPEPPNDDDLRDGTEYSAPLNEEERERSIDDYEDGPIY